MLKYTQDHIWLDIPDHKEDDIKVGITSRGNTVVGGIQFVDVMDNRLVVESTKTSFDFELPVTGALRTIRNDVDYSRNAGLGDAVACFVNWESFDDSSLLDEDPKL